MTFLLFSSSKFRALLPVSDFFIIILKHCKKIQNIKAPYLKLAEGPKVARPAFPFLQALTSHLRQEFTFTSIGNLGYFLGIEASHDAYGLYLWQSKYIIDVLHRSRMFGAKSYPALFVSGQKLSARHGESINDVTWQIVGALQYCMLSRPEIAYSINQLCQHLHAPTEIHWKSTKRVLRYLKCTIDHGLYFSKGTLGLTAYWNADWPGDTIDIQLTTEYSIFFVPCLVSRCAKKESVVST